MDDNDPWSWEDHVKIVDFLYDHISEWNPMKFPQKLPDRSRVSQQMEVNGYHGPLFLAGLSIDDIQQQLSLNSAQKYAFVAARRALRKLSEEYQKLAENDDGLIAQDNFTTTGKRHRETSTSHQSDDIRSFTPQVTPAIQPVLNSPRPSTSAPQDTMQNVTLSHRPAGFVTTPIVDSNSVPGRAHEVVVVDNKGRKRRRLTVMTTEQLPQNLVNGTQQNSKQDAASVINEAATKKDIDQPSSTSNQQTSLPTPNDSFADKSNSHLHREQSASAKPTFAAPDAALLQNISSAADQSDLDMERIDAASDTNEAEPQHSQNREVKLLTHGKKTLKLTTYTGVPDETSSREAGKSLVSVPKTNKHGYLGARSLNAHDFFFRSGGLGFESKSGNAEDFFLDDFSFTRVKGITNGQRLYANSMMRHFLNSSTPVSFTKDGKNYQGIVPYPTKVLPPYQNGSFLLLHSDKAQRSKPSVEKVDDWPEFVMESATELAKAPEIGDAGNSYVHEMIKSFEQRYKDYDDDKILSLDDLAEGDELDEETIREIEREEQGAVTPPGPSRRRLLSQKEVEDTIESEIAKIIGRWKTKHEVTKDRRAFKLWTKDFPKLRSKRERINAIQERLEDTRSVRLPKVRKRILEVDWFNASDVRRQCGSLTEFIEQIEDLSWEESILELDQAPPTPLKKAPRQAPRHREKNNAGAGDQDTTDSEDDLDDFIVADDEDDMPIGGEDAVGEPMAIDDSPIPLTRNAPVAKMVDSQDASKQRHDIIDDSDSSDISLNPLATTPSKPRSTEKSRRRTSLVDRGDSASNCIDLTQSDSNHPSPANGSKFSKPLEWPTAQTVKQEAENSQDSRILVERIDGHGSSDHDSGVSSPTLQVTDVQNQLLPTGPSQLGYRRDYDVEFLEHYSFGHYEGEEEGMEKDRQGWLLKFLWSRQLDAYELAQLAKKYAKDPARVRRQTRQFLLRAALDDGPVDLSATDDYRTRILIELFIMWHFCSEKAGTGPYDNELISNLANSDKRFKMFWMQLRLALAHITSWHLEHYGSHQKQDDSHPKTPGREDPEEPRGAGSSQAKKRKRIVKENVQARRQREADAERSIRHQQRFEELESDMHKGDKIVIGLGDRGEKFYTYVDQHIAAKIKHHQVEGVRFMWHEVVEAGQGCLLAHTMGLGKTMQVITLLTSLIDAALSPDEEISSKIPMKLRRLRILILCPPSLIDNWYEEILNWMPRRVLRLLGNQGIYPIRSAMPKPAKIRSIQEWSEQRGILILGYEIFRRFFSSEDPVAKIVFEKPSLVIADEAHKVKNRQAKVSQAASKFVTMSRIALTGSPLSNNLLEYYTTINWVAPGFLGEQKEFKQFYQDPIESGLDKDSSQYEKVRSRRKLEVLKETIKPKAHRRGLEVLKDEIPKKTEFLIQVPLTECQEQAYRAYVEAISDPAARAADTDITRAKLWAQLGILGLLCAHPLCYNQKLKGQDLEKIKDALKGLTGEAITTSLPGKGKQRASDANGFADQHDDKDQHAATSFPDPDELGIHDTGAKATAQINAYARLEGDDYGSSLSKRMLLLEQIVQLCKDAGEKLLIFSHSLWVLEFVEGLLVRNAARYERLDGSTKVGLRQQMCHEFNNATDFRIALISTKAGGVGLNLFGANRVVVLDFGFNPTWEEQAIGRAWRMGQEKPVFVYRFRAGGTFETKLHNTAVFKTQLATRVVDKKNIQPYSDRFTFENYVFPPKKVGFQNLSSFLGKDPKVLDHILRLQARDKAICSVELDETLRKDEQELLSAEDLRDVRREVQLEQLRSKNPAEYRKQRIAFDDEQARKTARFTAQATTRPAPPPSTSQYGRSGQSRPAPPLSSAYSKALQVVPSAIASTIGQMLPRWPANTGRDGPSGTLQNSMQVTPHFSATEPALGTQRAKKNASQAPSIPGQGGTKRR